MSELRGKLDHILYASPSGYTVAEFTALPGQKDQDGETLKRFSAHGFGVSTDTEKLVYEMSGDWKKSAKYGWQFSYKSAVVIVDKSAQGIKTYLIKCVKGIGTKTADSLYACFGDQTIETLDKHPEKLAKVPGISKRKMMQIIDSYQETKSISTVVTMLTPYGVDFSVCVQLQKEYGSRTIQLIKENPYKLSELTKGIAFQTAEKIAAAIGFDKHSPCRIKAALTQVLKDAENGAPLFRKEGGGHLCIPNETWMKKADILLNQRFIESATYSDEVVSDNEIWLCSAEMIQEKQAYIFKGGYVSREIVARTEDRVAREVIRLMCSDAEHFNKNSVETVVDDVARSFGIALAPEQREAAVTCLLNRITVITGGPGTGKSTILKVILAAYKVLYPKKANDIRLCAPTGKAARRMTDTTGMPATTLHSALGVYGEGQDSKREIEMLDTSFLIVDEVSMLDIYLAKQMLTSMPSGAKLLLVGDADQLPSIGPGAVLRDLIECEVIPVVKLQKIYRQAGTSPIIVNARLISKGISELTYNGDFLFVQRSDMSDAAEEITRLFELEADRVGIDEVTVLTPFRVNTQTGATQMAKKLRDIVNPSMVSPASPSYLQKTFTRGDKDFHIGDKVMQTKNRETVSNGDTGYITSIKTDCDGVKTVVVDFGEYNYCSYTDANIDEIVLAYATTIHKSQGSEYKTVIINIQNIHGSMLERNLIYTAITRAKERVYIVGDTEALKKAIDTQSSKHRSTLLAQRIGERYKRVFKTHDNDGQQKFNIM